MPIEAHLRWEMKEKIYYWFSDNAYVDYSYMNSAYLTQAAKEDDKIKQLLEAFKDKYNNEAELRNELLLKNIHPNDLGHIGPNDDYKVQYLVRVMHLCIKHNKIIWPMHFTYDENNQALTELMNYFQVLMGDRVSLKNKESFWKHHYLNASIGFMTYGKDSVNFIEKKFFYFLAWFGTAIFVDIVKSKCPKSKYNMTFAGLDNSKDKAYWIIANSVPFIEIVLWCLLGYQYKNTFYVMYLNTGAFFADITGKAKTLIENHAAQVETAILCNKEYREYTGLNQITKYLPRLEQITQEEDKPILGFTDKERKKRKYHLGKLNKDMKLQILSFEFPEAPELYAALEADRLTSDGKHTARFLDKYTQSYIERGL